MCPTTELHSIRTFRFEGSLDSAKCRQIDANLRTSLARTEAHIVFDLSEVRMVSSAFLGLCTFYRSKAAAHGFEVVNASPTVTEVFRTTGLQDMLTA
jgi:anti-anti-sigma factor